MTIQTFIEKAIEGGWNSNDQMLLQYEIHQGGLLWDCQIQISTAEILLDPEAWKAVGKVEGWYSSYDEVPEHEMDMPLCWCQPKNSAASGHTLTVHNDTTWRGYWHAMIDALADGKSIEEYLATI